MEGPSHHSLMRLARNLGLSPDPSMKRTELYEYIMNNGPDNTAEELRNLVQASRKAPPKAPVRRKKNRTPTPEPSADSEDGDDAPDEPPPPPPVPKSKPTIRVRKQQTPESVTGIPKLKSDDIAKIASRNLPKLSLSKTAPASTTAPRQTETVYAKRQDASGRWRWADGPNKGKYAPKEK